MGQTKRDYLIELLPSRWSLLNVEDIDWALEGQQRSGRPAEDRLDDWQHDAQCDLKCERMAADIFEEMAY